MIEASPMRFNTLTEWLSWQEQLHFTEIDPGLDRIRIVWQRLATDNTAKFPLITVAGTNGKGSSVAMLSSILQQAGYKTGTYTSPHLLRYNERICINGESATDKDIIAAFAKIDAARQDTSLTYFEFATLAAMLLFQQHQIDVAVMEVGMGGRLDAVNLFDADVALITPIGLDHTAWLGDTREKIGREKAGIMRAGQAVVCSELLPPQSVLDYANESGANISVAGRDYFYANEAKRWHWQSAEKQLHDLPLPALAGEYQLQNAAAVVAALSKLDSVDIDEVAIKRGLEQVKLAGRFQLIDGPVLRILDVTHNQQGADNLARLLKQQHCEGNTIAVVAMLKDKDASAVVNSLEDQIDQWQLGSLDGSRGMSSVDLAAQLKPLVSTSVETHPNVAEAYQAAMNQAQPGDRVLVFGSFHTVEAVMRLIPELIA